MREHLFALLIHEHPEPFESLKRTLRDLSVDTYSVTSCKEAEYLISQCKPQIIFAENCMSDGSWLSLLNRAEAEDAPVSIIVVGKKPDSEFYVAVMGRGAFDVVAPPFERGSLERTIQLAVLDARRRRDLLATVAAN